jgi:hypothetical protein
MIATTSKTWISALATWKTVNPNIHAMNSTIASMTKILMGLPRGHWTNVGLYGLQSVLQFCELEAHWDIDAELCCHCSERPFHNAWMRIGGSAESLLS